MVETREQAKTHLRPAEGRSVWVLGTQLMTCKVTAEQTCGAYSLFEGLVPAHDDVAAEPVLAQLAPVGVDRPGRREALALDARDLLDVLDLHRLYDVRHVDLSAAAG